MAPANVQRGGAEGAESQNSYRWLPFRIAKMEWVGGGGGGIPPRAPLQNHMRNLLKSLLFRCLFRARFEIDFHLNWANTGLGPFQHL